MPRDHAISLPQGLHPTTVQENVKHHPWIDLWPIPRMRDNILLAVDYNEDQLCNALIEFQDLPNDRSGLVVWGEPWDPASWEVCEAFAQNWAWVIQGCTELYESTNRWRSERGEQPIAFRA
ncbi:hypothetical protein GQ53DRAFT_744750 [Thozetella sp. PMI_491]|nr:hypothetical protein GQ53DRAFT_744750 [Thozetella sp. PMI_491]